MKYRFLLALLLFSGLALHARYLAIGLDKGPANDFNASLAEAKSMGLNASQLFINWNQIEPDSGVFDFTGGYIGWAPAWYRGQGLKLIVYVNPIHMWNKTVPADLANVGWDDPRMVRRYNALLDTIAGFLGDETVFFVIGNEVDSYLADSASCAKYRGFLNAAKAHFKSLKPAVPAGVAVTFGALVASAARNRLLSLNDSMDALMGTYYCTDADSVINPANLPAFVDTVVSLSSGKPVLFTELGYPSSSVLKSSVDKQAAFITQAFAAWETNKAKIPLINFMKQWEWSRADIASWLDTTTATPVLMAFLSSIGMHSLDGAAKPAWARLGQEASAHGFVTAVERTGAAENPGLRLEIRPNPFTTSFAVNFSAGPARTGVIRIFTVSGRQMVRTTARSNEPLTLKSSGWPDDLYFVSVSVGNRTLVKRLFLLK
jgi:hypothetical protein